MSKSKDLEEHISRDEGPPASAKGGEKGPLRIVITTAMISTIANLQLGIVIPLAVIHQTGSASTALFVFALRGVAYVVSPLLGALIDRFDQRTVFVVAQVEQAACIALLALAPNGWVGSVLLLASGVGAVANTLTGQFVLIPRFISEKGRSAAVAKLMTALELSRVCGLLLGGLAIASSGSVFSLLFVTGLYGAAGLVALFLPRVPTNSPRTTLVKDLRIGFTWLIKPDILWLVVTMAAVNLSIGQLEPVLVTVFDREGFAAIVMSCLLAVGLALTALASSLTPRLLPSWSVERRILLCQSVILAAMFLIAGPAVWSKIAGYFIISFALGYSNVVSITYRQSLIPIELSGRVNSVIRMIITGAVPLSGFLYAGAGHFSGFLFWTPGLLILTTAVTAWGVHTHRISQANQGE